MAYHQDVNQWFNIENQYVHSLLTCNIIGKAGKQHNSKKIIDDPPIQSKLYSALHTEDPFVDSIQTVKRWALDPKN